MQMRREEVERKPFRKAPTFSCQLIEMSRPSLSTPLHLVQEMTVSRESHKRDGENADVQDITLQHFIVMLLTRRPLSQVGSR